MDSLRFSRRSWHYWLYSRNIFFTRGHRKGAKNLCNYFWSIVGIVVGNLLLISAIVFILYRLGEIILTHLLDTLIYLAIFGALGVFFAGVWIVGSAWDQWRQRRRSTEEKKPNLLFSYLKAKKARYCPMIEWLD